MNNYVLMEASFEKTKNIKATAYTAFICGGLFLLFFLLQWSLPQMPQPINDEGIEVNLGNSETGLGDVPPQFPGNPSATNETNINQAEAKNSISEQHLSTTEIPAESDEAVSAKTIASVKKNNSSLENKIPKKNTSEVISTAPKPASPKALYKSGTANGTGGNNADSYNGLTNQGIAGGKGDQGNPNGNPNGDSYKGNAASGNGISIPQNLRNRGYKLPSLEDEFNENGKVAVAITVDANGNVVTAAIQPRGTTTTNPSLRQIALSKARQLKFGKSVNENEIGTIVFNFKVTN
jgi:outer membrane biosynthesis protein TonB